MFTIDGEAKEYPSLELAIAAARRLSRAYHRSMTILKNGKFHRFLRY
jgi:hypothetical protein